MDDQLRTESRLNASFSQNAWANAQLTGCLPRPCRPPPSWPPPPNEGFIYPTLEKKQQELLDGGVASGCPETYNLESPFAGGGQFNAQHLASLRQPVINTVNPNECPPNGISLKTNDTASRIAAKILGLPQPPSSSYMDVNRYNSGVTDPSPSPSPFEKSECLVNDSKFGLDEILPCTWNTVQGIVYDFNHWKQLPRTSSLSKLSYVLGRDDRLFYLTVLILFITVLYLFLRRIFHHKK